jgi:hypothetical protein
MNNSEIFIFSEHRGPKKMNNKKLFIFLGQHGLKKMNNRKIFIFLHSPAIISFIQICFQETLEPMPFDFQQRECFRLRIIFVLEDAAVGDTILHHFMRILPSTQEVDAGASVRDRQNVLVVVLFHDFGAGPDHPFHYLITGFSTVLQEKSAFVFGIQIFALTFEGAEMHFLQAFQTLVGHQFVRNDLQRIAGALGCGAVGVVEIDIIKVGTGDSGLLDAELRQRRITSALDFSADIEKGLAVAHQV